MHGRVLFLLGDLLGQHTRPHSEANSKTGFRNFLGPISEADRYSAGGLIGPQIPDDRLRALMRKLAMCIWRAGNEHEFWSRSAPLAEGAEQWENPQLPAGYTYVLQLIAHDIVDSACSVTAEGARLGIVNARSRPLALDTIYGSGPDEVPLAYEFDRHHEFDQTQIPRIRLRIGPARQWTGLSTLACPFRDIARGRISDEDVSDDGNHGQLREALVADPRNDDNFIVSQLTALWHLLHNHIIDLVRSTQKPLPNLSSRMARAYLLFFCARLATTLIYRNIIVQDVLPRILHPTVRDHYLQSDLDDQGKECPSCGVLKRRSVQIRPNVLQDNEAGIALEFSHGAFRFGHAMVREEYRVNGRELVRLKIKDTSKTQVGEPFVRTDWLVDWVHFFCVDESKATPNRSQRIGPNYSSVLNELRSKVSDFEGLANQELRSASYAQVWSVPKLFERLAAHRLGGLALGLGRPSAQAPLRPYDIWREPIRQWLRDNASASAPLTDDDIARIANDPPLPFFVLFEAAYDLRAGTPDVKGPPSGGAYLGPFGSIIVAETICGALARHPIAFEKPDTTLEARLAECCSVLLGKANAQKLAGLAAIHSMEDLVRYLVDAGVFGPQSSCAASS